MANSSSKRTLFGGALAPAGSSPPSRRQAPRWAVDGHAPVAPIKPTATLPTMVDLLADIIIPITISGAFFALQLLLGKKGMLIGWSHLSM